MRKGMRFLIFAMASSVLMGCGGEKCDRSGFICTFAGVPQEAQFGKEDVPAVESQLYLPQDIVFADDGTAYFPDFNNHRIRTIGVDGIVHSVAGTGFLGDGPEGPAEVFAWNHPTNLAIDPSNPSLIYIAAWHNSRINVLDLDAETVTFECGTGGRDFAGDGGDALMAVLDLPSSVAFDRDGNLYISDQANQAIRKVDPLGVIETIAGSPGSPNAAEINKDPALEPVEDATTGYAGDGGPAEDALLFAETGQQADPSSKLTIHRDTL